MPNWCEICLTMKGGEGDFLKNFFNEVNKANKDVDPNDESQHFLSIICPEPEYEKEEDW